jgi:hypothetical protein
MNIIKAKPLFEKLLNPNCEMASHEEMVIRFQSLLAKGTKVTIRPTTVLKSIGHPQTILEGKPSLILCLGSFPCLPHQGVHIGENET